MTKPTVEEVYLKLLRKAPETKYTLSISLQQLVKTTTKSIAKKEVPAWRRLSAGTAVDEFRLHHKFSALHTNWDMELAVSPKVIQYGERFYPKVPSFYEIEDGAFKFYMTVALGTIAQIMTSWLGDRSIVDAILYFDIYDESGNLVFSPLDEISPVFLDYHTPMSFLGKSPMTAGILTHLPEKQFVLRRKYDNTDLTSLVSCMFDYCITGNSNTNKQDTDRVSLYSRRFKSKSEAPYTPRFITSDWNSSGYYILSNVVPTMDKVLPDHVSKKLYGNSWITTKDHLDLLD